MNRIFNLLLIVFWLCLAPSKAHAYLDAGTGSMIFQVAAASVVGLIFTVKTYFRNIKAAVTRLFGGTDSTPPSN